MNIAMSQAGMKGLSTYMESSRPDPWCTKLPALCRSTPWKKTFSLETFPIQALTSDVEMQR